MTESALPPINDAPQHGPRPLPLFLAMLRNETAANPALRERAMAGLARYQHAPRTARRPVHHVVATSGRAALREVGGNGNGPPVVLVPSLINPPHILDLADDVSLARVIAERGKRVLLVDWGEPQAADSGQDVTHHVEALLAPMLRTLDRPPVLVGYCLGGTMAAAAAAIAPAAGLALIAAPWRFAEYGERALGDIARLWRAAEPMCERMGVVPMEVLQSGFWALDPQRTIAKFANMADSDEASLARFVLLEDWANAGAPLTLAAGRQLFERFLTADDPGRGRWIVGGRPIDPVALPCPVIAFASLSDRIVPASTTAPVADRHDVAAGHVGMIVGGNARTTLWRPLIDWIDALPHPK